MSPFATIRDHPSHYEAAAMARTASRDSKTPRLVMGALLVLAVSACTPQGANSAYDGRRPGSPSPRPPSSSESSSSSPGLIGTEWMLVSYLSSERTAPSLRNPEPVRITIRLQADGNVVIKLDCNNGGGRWTGGSGRGTAGQIRFGPLASTMMGCPDDAVQPVVSHFAGHVDQVRAYRLAEGELHLLLDGDRGTYVFRPAGR